MTVRGHIILYVVCKRQAPAAAAFTNRSFSQKNHHLSVESEVGGTCCVYVYTRHLRALHITQLCVCTGARSDTTSKWSRQLFGSATPISCSISRWCPWGFPSTANARCSRSAPFKLRNASEGYTVIRIMRTIFPLRGTKFMLCKWGCWK